MIAFEVSHNGQRLCTAGVGQHGVLSAIVTWTLRDAVTLAGIPEERREDAAQEDLRLQVGGLADGTHYGWPTIPLHPGDEVLVRVCEAASVYAPSDSRPSPGRDIAEQHKYVHQMCLQWGWQLTES